MENERNRFERVCSHLLSCALWSAGTVGLLLVWGLICAGTAAVFGIEEFDTVKVMVDFGIMTVMFWLATTRSTDHA